LCKYIHSMKLLMIKILPIISLVLSLTGCYVTQFQEIERPESRPKYYSDLPPSGKPGRCYAKCLISDVYETEVLTLPIYIGDKDIAINDPNIESKEIVIKAESTNWEKKKVDKNCLSKKPDNCLVWCLITIPKEAKYVYVVKDTMLNKEFRMQEFIVDKLVVKGGYSDWKEVICDSDVNTDFIINLQEALTHHKYYTGVLSGNFDSDIKTALVKCQKENGLPVGSLDFETLDFLGVKY
jgi:hypothetical protein